MHNHNHCDIAHSAPRHSGIVEVYDSLARSHIKGWLPSLYINNNTNLFGKTKSKSKQIQIDEYIK